MKEILKDDKITLRALEATDLEDMLRWENDTRLWDVSSTIAPYTKHILWDYLKNYDGDIYKSHQIRFIIQENGTEKSVGALDLFDFDPFNRRVAIGILVDYEFQNLGYGAKTLELAKEYAFFYLGLKQCHCIIATDNTHSISAFKKAGFEECGTMKAWLRRGTEYYDAVFMQIVAD